MITFGFNVPPGTVIIGDPKYTVTFFAGATTTNLRSIRRPANLLRSMATGLQRLARERPDRSSTHRVYRSWLSTSVSTMLAVVPTSFRLTPTERDNRAAAATRSLNTTDSAPLLKTDLRATPPSDTIAAPIAPVWWLSLVTIPSLKASSPPTYFSK